MHRVIPLSFRPLIYELEFKCISIIHLKKGKLLRSWIIKNFDIDLTYVFFSRCYRCREPFFIYKKNREIFGSKFLYRYGSIFCSVCL